MATAERTVGLLPLLTDHSSEPALDNAATAGGVAQLTGHLTAAALYITDIATADRAQ